MVALVGVLAPLVGLGFWGLKPPASVEAADALGWDSDAIEAQAFGFLATRGLKGLPLSYPATTGVPIPMTGGIIARP